MELRTIIFTCPSQKNCALSKANYTIILSSLSSSSQSHHPQICFTLRAVPTIFSSPIHYTKSSIKPGNLSPTRKVASEQVPNVSLQRPIIIRSPGIEISHGRRSCSVRGAIIRWPGRHKLASDIFAPAGHIPRTLLAHQTGHWARR